MSSPQDPVGQILSPRSRPSHQPPGAIKNPLAHTAAGSGVSANILLVLAGRTPGMTALSIYLGLDRKARQKHRVTMPPRESLLMALLTFTRDCVILHYR